MSEHAPQSFPLTRWSLILRARGGDGGHPLTDAQSRQALDDLLRRYLPALRTHLLVSRRVDPDTAADLLQGFVASRVVENGLLDRVGPGKGRFRTYLLYALNNFVIDQIRAQRAQKRAAANVYSLEALDTMSPADGDDRAEPAAQFELVWARQVIDHATELMRERCAREGRSDIWEVFVGRVLAPALDGAAPVPYDELVARFGYETPEQASNVLTTAKRTFQRCLRQVVADYCDESEVDDEIRELRALVARQ